MILRISLFIISILNVYSISAQNIPSESLHMKLATITEQALDSISKTTPVVFTNKGCSRCVTAKTQLNEAQIPYYEVDLGVSSNRELMYSKVVAISGKTNIGVTFPIIFFEQSVLYGQQPLKEFIDKLAIDYAKLGQDASSRKAQ
jgi:glutaredoxin